jgi:hypothetical protein
MARELRTVRQDEYMATKVRIMKMLQEIRGFAQITSRRPPAKVPGLFLVQLRSNAARTNLYRKKVIITVDLKDPPDIPHPVKITHLKAAAIPAVAQQAQ